MIGVVLWSDPCEGKAVFWCEDQGDLAYYVPEIIEATGTDLFDAGDMVQFEVSVERRIRKAHNAQLLQERACVGLPESLRAEPEPEILEARTTRSAKILPFKLDFGVRLPSLRKLRKA